MCKQILLVEDDASLREWMQYELIFEGYGVETAGDGLSALTKINNSPTPDVILLDVQLPGMNGFQVCQSLQADPLTAAIPVVFLTARASLDDKLTGFESGGVDYLPKPFKMEELKARIKALLRMGELERRLAETAVDEEMTQAAAIQNSLMARGTPQVPGLDISAECHPAKRVGGDFYDFQLDENNRVCIVEADVCGKGLAAALIMTSTRTALRGATRSMSQPNKVLQTTSDQLYDDLTEVGKFVTAFMACYEPDSRQLSWSNAGHSLAVYLPAGGTPQILEADGPPLGVLTSFDYEHQQVVFGSGDLLALCSDGLYEAENSAGKMYGFEQLLSVLGSSAGKSAADIVADVFSDVGKFSANEEQGDDQTLVIVKGTPS